MKLLLAFALLCASAAHAQTGTAEWWLDGDPAKSYSSQATCDAAALALNLAKVYACPRMYRVKPKPVPCPTAPQSSQVVQCTAPTTGSWTQTRTVLSATSPQCWVTGQWTPTTAPAGACTTPTTATWSFLGFEETSQTVAANSTVRYGFGTAWVEKVISGTFICGNALFGDPLQGTRKQCELKSSGTTPPATGSATVSWTAPTTNADGTPLTDLAGFRVLYGKVSGTYTQSIDVGAPPLTVPNLAAGSWYFVVRAIDTSGLESASSAEVSKAVQ